MTMIGRRNGGSNLVVALAIAVLAAGIAFVVLATRVPSAPDLPALWPAPEFALVDQHGDTVRTDDLTGSPWIASFIFTNCTGVCPTISARMARLRDSLAVDGLLGRSVRLVSFTVDPARDTPAVLLDYAERYGGSSPSEWTFLTGSPPTAVRQLIQEGFHLTAVDPPADHADDDYQVMHAPRLLLVDSDGVVRAAYPAGDPDVVDRVLADVRGLAAD